MNFRGMFDIVFGYGYEYFDEYCFGDEFCVQELIIISYNFFVEYSMSDYGLVVINLFYFYINENIRGVQDGFIFIKIWNGLWEFLFGRFNIIIVVGFIMFFFVYLIIIDMLIGYGVVQFQGCLVV